MEAQPTTRHSRIHVRAAGLAWPMITAAVLVTTAPLRAATPEELYTTALSQEHALRAPDEAVASLDELRAAVGSYQAIVNRFPTSGYSDNALWQAAGLSIEAFDRYRDPQDRDRSVALLRHLEREYPASPLASRVAGRVSSLERLDGPIQLRRITRETVDGVVRVTIELDAEVEYLAERLDGPPRLYFDFSGTDALPPLRNATLNYEDGDIVRQIRLGRHPDQVTRVVLDLAEVDSYSFYTLYDPYRLVVESVAAADTQATAHPHRVELLPTPEELSARLLEPLPATVAPMAAVRSPEPTVHDVLYPWLAEAPTEVRARPTRAPVVTVPPSRVAAPPTPNSTGALSLGRQLGLGVSRVVIDPGHGGYDPGAQTATLTESALVLDVAKRLGRRLESAGIDVVLTRRDDVFVPLRDRTELANGIGADLLLSIHANAARDPGAQGIETYFLDLTSDPTSQAVAARENATARERMSDLPQLVRSITMNNKIDESRDLAELVQRNLIGEVRALNPAAQDLGVKRAPFVVLVGATMPSVLAEISFLTNEDEAAFLATDAYRDRIADALYRSVLEYQTTLKPWAPSVAAANDDD